MQKGYRLMEAHHASQQASDLWLEAWHILKALAVSTMRTCEAYDQVSRGCNNRSSIGRAMWKWNSTMPESITHLITNDVLSSCTGSLTFFLTK